MSIYSSSDMNPELHNKNGKLSVIDFAATFLRETVDFATAVYSDCVRNPANSKDENHSIFLLILHMIEMTDGVALLIEQGCAIPAIPIVRSCFEALISLEYIAQEDTLRRSLAWHVGQIHNQLAYHELHDPDTQLGVEHHEALSNDRYLRLYEFPVPGEKLDDFREKEEKLRAVLAKPPLDIVEIEYQDQRRKMRKGRHPQWFQLFDGPENIRRLAIKVGAKATYDDFYQVYSSVSHPQNMARFMKNANADQGSVFLRDPAHIRNVTSYAASFMMHGVRILNELMPSTSIDVKRWYVVRWEPAMTILSNQDLFLEFST